MCLSFFGSISAQFHLAEKRIRPENTPEKIISYVKKNYPDARVKYYKINTLEDSILYEAKVKVNKEVFYLIFDEQHLLIRTENSIEFSSVPAKIKEKVAEDLSKRFSKFSIDKCQRQYSENKIFYEVKLEAKEKSIKKKYIFLFDSNGFFVRFKELPPKPLGQIFH